MKSKDELCNELIKFSKQHLAFEFEDVYGTEENCYKNYDYILSNQANECCYGSWNSSE